jgi:hypothetical protein
MKRFHNEINIMKRRLDLMKKYGHDFAENWARRGRVRKKHPLDCGKPNCFICHCDKNLKKKSFKYRKDLEKLND